MRGRGKERGEERAQRCHGEPRARASPWPRESSQWADAAAIAANLARGRRHVACGCAGPAGSQTIHWGLVARNLLLALLAVAAAYPSTQRPLVWFDAVTGTGALACLALLYAASDVALANLGRLRALRAGP